MPLPQLESPITLPFPSGGVSRRASYDAQQEKYCADALNVWPTDTLTGRMRGGSRPGLETLGALDGRARMLSHMNFIDVGVNPHKYKSVLLGSGGGSLSYSDSGAASWIGIGSGLYSDRPISVATHRQRVYACVTAGVSHYLKYWDFGLASPSWSVATPGAGATTGTGTLEVKQGSAIVTLNTGNWPDNAVTPKWLTSAALTITAETAPTVQTLNFGPIGFVSRDSSTQATLAFPLDLETGQYSWSIVQRSPPPCVLACAWHDCVVLGQDVGDTAAGIAANPHLFYMSHIGDGTNWNFGLLNDTGSAVRCNDSPGAGSLGEHLTALIPFSDDQLYIGGSYSLSVLDGHPNAGGVLQFVDKTVGPLGQNSWCIVPTGSGNWIVFLSKQGLYGMPAGGRPMPISRRIIPDALMGLDPSSYETCVGYDLRYQGLVVSASPIGGGTPVNYFVSMDGLGGGDLENGFWPMSYPAISQPFAMYTDPTFSEIHGTEGSLLLGGSAGSVSRHKSDVGNDGGAFGQSVSGSITYGPYKLAPSGYIGALMELIVVLSSGSGPMSVDILVGNSAEQAVNATTFKTYSLPTAGVNRIALPNAGGSHCCLRFYADSDVRWSVEEVTIDRQTIGIRRAA